MPDQFIGIVCDHETLDISCPGNQKIRILTVFYGRADKRHCITRQSSMANTNCRSSTAEYFIRAKCDGKNRCTQHVNGGTLQGDPCVGIHKYLKVEYTCEGELFQISSLIESLMLYVIHDL